MSKKYIYIKADENDADYVKSLNEITDENLELIRPLLTEIKNCSARNNWPAISEYRDCELHILYPNHFKNNKEVLDDEDEDDEYDVVAITETAKAFEYLLPYSEEGIHTIKEIKILEVINEESLL